MAIRRKNEKRDWDGVRGLKMEKLFPGMESKHSMGFSHCCCVACSILQRPTC